MAAAYCRRLAAQRGLALRATSAGTEPHPEVSPPVVSALRAEDIDVSDHRPRRVIDEELGAAWRIISLGCKVDGLARPKPRVERWDDVPPLSQGVAAAGVAIFAHIRRLLDDLSQPQGFVVSSALLM
jgi:hypothetical protein